MKIIFKCRKCRTILLNYPDTSLISAHGQSVSLKEQSNSAKIEFTEVMPNEVRPACSSLEQALFYINEINLPDWIIDCVDKYEWTRGKLICPSCSARVGSFDFVSGFHCACGNFVVPPIHLVHSKIDLSSRENLL